MLPVKECDTATCLEKLVGIRADCADNNCHRLYVEDLDGFDLSKYANIATLQSPSGKQKAKDIISSSAREMLADLETMMFNTYRLEETFGSICGTTDFISGIYTQGAGIKITNLVSSSFAQIKVSRLEILTDRTGTANLVLDDGSGTNTIYEVQLQAGVIMPVVLDYTTSQKYVKVYFDDNTIGVATISTAQSSGCNCGGRKSKAENSISFKGIINGSDASLQYGFKACAAIVCNNDTLVCDMVNQVPNMFALALFYKVGSKSFSESVLSDRLNKYTLENPENKITMKQFYADQYRYHMNGTKAQKGIKNVVETYLKGKRKSDKCIICDAALSVGWITG